MHKPNQSEWKKAQDTISSHNKLVIVYLLLATACIVLSILSFTAKPQPTPYPLICSLISSPNHYGTVSENGEVCTVIFEDLSVGEFYNFLTFIPNH